MIINTLNRMVDLYNMAPAPVKEKVNNIAALVAEEVAVFAVIKGIKHVTGYSTAEKTYKRLSTAWTTVRTAYVVSVVVYPIFLFLRENPNLALAIGTCAVVGLLFTGAKIYRFVRHYHTRLALAAFIIRVGTILAGYSREPLAGRLFHMCKT